MRRRLVATGLAAAVLAGGCRTPKPLPVVEPPPPRLPPAEFPVVQAVSLEPDLLTLPPLDPTAAAVAPPAGVQRRLTEAACGREAAARAPLATTLLHENRVPPPAGCPPADWLLRQVRVHLAAEARNRAAGDALDQFFQLADADGRADLLRESAGVLDRLRATVRDGRAKGLRVVLDPDDLDRQRAALIATLVQADLGAALLDGELKRRTGVLFGTPERLRPVGPFPAVSAGPTDVPAAVAVALEKRPDLLALRTVYHGLTPDTLPVARAALKDPAGLLGLAPPATPRKPKPPTPAEAAEVAVRRDQLADLIADRERQAADQVRAACLTLDAQSRQVGLARWRADGLTQKATDASKDGPLVELPARLEAFRARSEVVAAVMGYHQARVKLRAAQGLAAE